MLLVLPDETLFTTDGRYGDQSAEQLARAGVDARIEVRSTVAAQHALVADAACDVGRLGLEAESVTWAQQRRFAAQVFESAELVATEGLIEELRKIKDAGEVARVAEAARIADQALASVRPPLLPCPGLLRSNHPVVQLHAGLSLDCPTV